MINQRSILVAAAYLLTSQAAMAESFPAFPAADFMNVKIVGENMIVNGLPMAAYEFSSKREPNAVVEYYKEQWGVNHMTDVNFGDWRILSHRDDDYLLTVQIENNSQITTHGTLGITPAFRHLAKSKTKLRSQAAKMGKGFPTLPGTEILNDITAVDQGRESRTVMFKNERSIYSNLSYYQQKMGAKGWQNVLPQVPESAKKTTQALAMNKGSQQFNLSFSKVAGETYGVAVYVN